MLKRWIFFSSSKKLETLIHLIRSDNRMIRYRRNVYAFIVHVGYKKKCVVAWWISPHLQYANWLCVCVPLSCLASDRRIALSISVVLIWSNFGQIPLHSTAIIFWSITEGKPIGIVRHKSHYSPYLYQCLIFVHIHARYVYKSGEHQLKPLSVLPSTERVNQCEGRGSKTRTKDFFWKWMSSVAWPDSDLKKNNIIYCALFKLRLP